jgi:hypothetical protein
MAALLFSALALLTIFGVLIAFISGIVIEQMQ